MPANTQAASMYILRMRGVLRILYKDRSYFTPQVGGARLSSVPGGRLLHPQTKDTSYSGHKELTSNSYTRALSCAYTFSCNEHEHGRRKNKKGRDKNA